MSLSQKFSGFSIVPWYNSAEWKRVYHLIFDNNPTVQKRKEALNVLNLWKSRMNLLPSGVEGTLYILEASLIDSEMMSERQCCILYASNIMRFLNICVANRSQVFNFTKTAKSYSIPDWIINIRHDFAHSPKVPSFAILKLALVECFKWLKETYWDPELAVIKDYVITKESNDTRRVIRLIANLIVWLNSEKSLPAEISAELESFGIDSVDVNNFPEVVNELFGNVGDGCGVDQVKWDDVINDLIFSGCFFINPAWTDTKTVYTYKYISKLIDHLQVNNNLANLVSELCHVMNDAGEFEANKIIVSRWLNEIFIGMLRQRPLKCNVDLDVLKGKGIRFSTASEHSFEEVTNLKHIVLQHVNDISRKCFNSYMLLCKSYSLKDCNDFFNQLKDAESKLSWQKLQECDDEFTNLSKSVEVHVSDSTFSANIPTLGTESNDLLPEKRKKRWILETDPNYERCPLGVHPSTLNSTMEIF